MDMNGQIGDIQISILILTYNSKWSDLNNTLNSIMAQRDIIYEIVIADDGSKDNFEEKINEYFHDRHFSQYTLVMNDENKGTVSNVISGLEKCKGKWVKDISPGDSIYGDGCLGKWVSYNERHKYVWSFSEAVFYRKRESKYEIISCNAHPVDLTPYLRHDFERCRWNYVALKDVALGATMICQTKAYLDYCRRIRNKVIYAEDNVWRLMMFDGVFAGYYPEVTVLYEYGEGISTSGKGKWRETLQKDWDITTEMLIDTDCHERLQKKIQLAIKRDGKKCEKIFIKGKVRMAMKKHMFPRKTMLCLHEGDNACK